MNLEGTLPRIVCLAIGGVNSKYGYFLKWLDGTSAQQT
jgi:hypothetical protein